MKCHLYELFFFLITAKSLPKDLSDTLQKYLCSLILECQSHIRTGGLLGAMLLVSALSPILVFLVSTTQCLTEDCSSSKQNDDKCP